MNRVERDEWLGCFLTEMEVSQLEGVFVSVAPDRTFRLLALLTGWRNHVARIESELDHLDSDTTVWGVYDLIAALALRSFIARGVGILDSSSFEGFKRALDDVDSRFRGFTEGDDAGVVRRLDGGDRPSGEWWWDRLPRTGPIRREIERIKLQSSEP
ncbi:hypothetical protein [Amycolatopsis thermoflava]|uniref:hypothetical protein n=1 Tax=Amycolatopsis thermoflava TaxID=84480 RepID=UPI0038032089